jgi:hypothetical protein
LTREHAKIVRPVSCVYAKGLIGPRAWKPWKQDRKIAARQFWRVRSAGPLGRRAASRTFTGACKAPQPLSSKAQRRFARNWSGKPGFWRPRQKCAQFMTNVSPFLTVSSRASTIRSFSCHTELTRARTANPSPSYDPEIFARLRIVGRVYFAAVYRQKPVSPPSAYRCPAQCPYRCLKYLPRGLPLQFLPRLAEGCWLM